MILKKIIWLSFILFLFSCKNRNYSKEPLPPNCIIVKNKKFDLYAIKDTLRKDACVDLMIPNRIGFFPGNFNRNRYEFLTRWCYGIPESYYDDTTVLKKIIIEAYEQKLKEEAEYAHIIEENEKKIKLQNKIDSSWQ